MIAKIRQTIGGGALRSPQFRLLMTAGMAMQLGQWIQRVALLWTVYELTGSAVQLAGLGFLSNIFVLVLSPFVGPLSDRYGARRVLLGAALGQAIGAIVLSVAVFGGFASIPLLYVIGMGFGIGQSLNGPTRNLLVYDTVGRDLLRNGIALNSLTGSTMRVIGPSFGGLILGLRGADLAFGIQAVLLILALWLVFLLKVDSRRLSAREGSMWRSLAGGVAHLKENAPVRVNVLTAFVASTFVYPYVQFMPLFVAENMQGSETELGLLFSGVGIGSLVGLWYVAAGRGNMPAMLWAGTIYMVLIGAFALATEFWLGFALLIAAGVVHSVFSGLNQALVQLNSEEEYRARVLGIYSMSGGLEPFSFLALGVLMDHIGAGNAMAASSGLAAAFVALLAVRATMGAFQPRPRPSPPAEGAPPA
ncbi:MAG: MFS transporter [Dehalococcoidia bacterium]|nr:MFS transporter [Dehalococcoidia bacterium]